MVPVFVDPVDLSGTGDTLAAAAPAPAGVFVVDDRGDDLSDCCWCCCFRLDDAVRGVEEPVRVGGNCCDCLGLLVVADNGFRARACPGLFERRLVRAPGEGRCACCGPSSCCGCEMLRGFGLPKWAAAGPTGRAAEVATAAARPLLDRFFPAFLPSFRTGWCCNLARAVCKGVRIWTGNEQLGVAGRRKRVRVGRNSVLRPSLPIGHDSDS